jgi:hypothetical protein
VTDTPPQSRSEYVCIATYLPLRRWRDVPAFLRLVGRVLQQAKESPGNLAAATRANPLGKRFWTCTVWTDKPSVSAFLRAEPHATAIGRMAAWAADDAAFAEWNVADSAVHWDEAMRRLEQPTYYYKGSS